MILKKTANNKFARYVFFAILTSIINIGVYLGFYDFIIKSIIICNIVAYTVSIVLQFILNRRVVFKSTNGNVFIQGLLFILTKVIAFFIDSLVLVICFKFLHFSNFLSKLISNCSTTISNYVLNDKLVFKK